VRGRRSLCCFVGGARGCRRRPVVNSSTWLLSSVPFTSMGDERSYERGKTAISSPFLFRRAEAKDRDGLEALASSRRPLGTDCSWRKKSGLVAMRLLLFFSARFIETAAPPFFLFCARESAVGLIRDSEKRLTHPLSFFFFFSSPRRRGGRSCVDREASLPSSSRKGQEGWTLRPTCSVSPFFSLSRQQKHRI